jgi:hypothetical protein
VYARFNMEAVSVRETAAMHRPAVVPNPAQQTLRITDYPPNTRLQIFDSFGKLLISLPDYSGEDLDVTFLPAGVYMLKTNNATETDAILFCIQR